MPAPKAKRTSALDWPALAASLAAAIPRARLHPSVLAWAEDCSRRASWGIGFSGGADSLALLLLLWAHWPERRARLRALHFDHRLRGAESTADARFCREVCRALGVGLVAERWDRPRLPGKKSKANSHPSKPVSEAAARAARQAFFAEHARIVWLGHQQDDIAETMLMRLSRGSGLGGLAAPRPVQALAARRTHLRPLLTLKKAEILAALRGAGIPWREDSSNDAGDFFRNRIRRDILPAWNEASRRDALAGAARSRALLEEDEAALDGWVDRLDPLDARGRLVLAKLEGEPRAVVRRALHRWMLAQRRPLEISSQAFEALLTAVEVGRPTRHSLGAERFGEMAGGVLRLVSGGKLRRKFQRGVN